MSGRLILKDYSTNPLVVERKERSTAVAAVLLTSEDPNHPIENAFDGQRGPGGSRWIAIEPGDQTIVLAFDQPQTIRRVALEMEENHTCRTQVVQISVSSSRGWKYQELLQQEYDLDPTSSNFKRDDCAVSADHVTHLKLRISPDKEGKPYRATLTSLEIS